MPISDGLVQWAERAPAKPALICGAEHYRYGELCAAARQIAAGVAALPNATPRVGLLLGNRSEFITIFLGVTLAGGVAMTLDPHWQAAQLEPVLRTLTPDLLFADAKTAAIPLELGIETVVLDDDSRGMGFAAWCARQFGAYRSCADNAPFLIGFTSGSSGQPKAFIRNHASWQASFAASRIEFGTHAGDDILAPGPLTHGLTLYAVMEGLAAGATVTICRKFTALDTLAVLRRRPVTMLVAVPTMLQALADTVADTLCPTPRAVISSGAKLSPELRTRLTQVFSNAAVLEYYGASELSFVTLASARENCPPASVGRAFHGVQVSIRRPDGSPAPVGEVGRVGVRSALLSDGYLAASADGFRIEQGWATVGDWGWQDRQGYLYLAGREGDMLISGGLNVYPAEIEAQLQAMPEIAAAVVLGLPDAYWGDLICAVIRWQDEMQLTQAELKQRLRAQVPFYKCPRRFFAAATLPLTESGKIARATVREWLLAAAPSLVEIR